MLLSITTTYSPARDLGYLLHKHPDRAQEFMLPFGTAQVFYPEATDSRCTASLLLEIDPVGLVRGRRDGASSQEHYVNDRPYAASSFLSVAIAQVYGTALAGRCDTHPDLAATAIPLKARLAVVPCRGGDHFLRRLFEPLGYQVSAERHPLDEQFPEWGDSRYYTVEISGETRLSELLTHLYVLMPVLDNDKHYWVGDAEVEKLLRRGQGWLDQHPERNEITHRYLKRRGDLVRDALSRLVEPEEAVADDDTGQGIPDEREQTLHEQRIGAVLAALRHSGARSVLDLGCGEGRLLAQLALEPQFERIVGLDVSHRALERAARRLKLDSATQEVRERVRLLHGALTYRDRRLEGFDAAAVVEVIEHLDPGRLADFERVVFDFARPETVVLTTPNREYNSRFEGMSAGQLRHPDHRFEWTRDEFHAWVGAVASRHGYTPAILPVGPEAPDVGPPSQMAVFTRQGREAAA